MLVCFMFIAVKPFIRSFYFIEIYVLYLEKLCIFFVDTTFTIVPSLSSIVLLLFLLAFSIPPFSLIFILDKKS